MPVSRRLWLSLIACVASSMFGRTLLLAQGPADVTFHADSQVVLVDAVVADKKGQVPRDLTQQDFKILEDGKEQKITTFSLESIGGAGHSQHFVALLFESNDLRFRDDSVRFVDSFASPNLYIAVYARADKRIRLLQGFTADPVRIKAALGSMQVTPLKEDIAVEVHHSTHLAGIGELAATLAPIRGRKALIEFGWNLTNVRNENGGAARTADGGWVKPLWPPPVVAQLSETVDLCNQANVSVYSFDVAQRLRSFGDFAYRPPRPEDDRGAVLNEMQDLAVRTGGRYTASGFDDLVSYLGSVAAEQDDYYVLGFVPTGESADKPCHKLKVTVDRKGLDVNARESYCTSGAPDTREAKPQKALEARMADGAAGTVKVGMQLPWFYAKRNLPLVEMAMDIDPSAMKVKGKLRGEIDLAGVVYRQDGSVATRIGETLNLEFGTQEQMDAFLKTPFHYSKEFTVAPGRYDVRVAVGSADQAFGRVEKPLEIDPWGGETLTVSALALSDDDRPLPGLTAELHNEMVEGPHRLGSKGRESVPMGGAEFHTNGLAYFYFEVYEPRLAQATDATPVKPPVIRIRVLDRKTGQAKEDSGPMDASDWMEPGNPVMPIALTLPVASLAAGAYSLEVRVEHDGGQDAVVRTADFEVK
jgi:VWFA-related protein